VSLPHSVRLRNLDITYFDRMTHNTEALAYKERTHHHLSALKSSFSYGCVTGVYRKTDSDGKETQEWRVKVSGPLEQDAYPTRSDSLPAGQHCPREGHPRGGTGPLFGRL
jgi:hypothetical protein